MKCKNCGGEISFQNGIGLCQSCGATFALDSIYENIDVCLCYEESDEAGRRRHDSIIAQEVYRKLEENKITTYYERVSADGMAGSDLETSKLAAIHKAKIIVVLGTSIERFTTLETKYGEYFEDKPVIPFCVGVNPGAIPKTLSKIQAMSYSTIGWDKDLIKGVCNILGRAPDVDTTILYARKKKQIILIGAVVVAVIVSAVLAARFYLKAHNTTDGPNVLQTEESTEKTPTQGEIYENAQELLNNGYYLEAAEAFNKIYDYKDSSNQIKKIYDRYDGYYQDEEQVYSLYLNIVDGKTAEVSFEKTIDNKIIKIDESAILDNNQINIQYIDSLGNEGFFSVTLNNKQIDVSVSTTSTTGELSIGEADVVFLLASKSDRPPIKTITKELLLSWVTSPTFVDDIKLAGHELEHVTIEQIHFFGQAYRIVNTDIEIFLSDYDLSNYSGDDSETPPVLDKSPVLAILAPVNLICPEKVGEKAYAFTNDGVAFVPNATGCNIHVNSWGFSTNISASNPESFTIKEDSYVGISLGKEIGESNDNSFVDDKESFDRQLYQSLVFSQFEKDHPNTTEYYNTHILKQTNKSALVCVFVPSSLTEDYLRIPGSCYYYKLDLTTETVTFIVKHGDIWCSSFQYCREEWKEYPDVFGEFLIEYGEAVNREPSKTEATATEQTSPTQSEQTTTNPTEQMPPTEPEEPVQYVLYSVRFDAEVAVYSEPTQKDGIGYYPSEDDEIVCYLPAGTYNIVGWEKSGWGIWGRLEGDIGWIFYSDSDIIYFD